MCRNADRLPIDAYINNIVEILSGLDDYTGYWFFWQFYKKDQNTNTNSISKRNYFYPISKFKTILKYNYKMFQHILKKYPIKIYLNIFSSK